MRFNDTDKMGKMCNGAYCTVSFLFYAISCKFLWPCNMIQRYDVRLFLLGYNFLTQYQEGKCKSKAINNKTRTTSLNIIIYCYL